MARQFHRELNLPGVRIPDWDLLARLEELFRPYRPIENEPGGREGVGFLPWGVGLLT